MYYNFSRSGRNRLYVIMNKNRQISLLTLVGLILPLGNIWGSYLIKIPQGSPSYFFRKKLTVIETVMTAITFVLAIVFSLKGINSGNKIDYAVISLYIVILQYIAIIGIAFVSAFMTPKFTR